MIRRRWIATAVVVGLATMTAHVLGVLSPSSPRTPADLAIFVAKLTQDFPDVRHVETEGVSALLAATARPAVQIIDAREPSEFAVSHLEGARNLPPASSDADILAAIDPSRPVLVYCSVGYRSAIMAQRLKDVGAKDVSNYAGSIFAWANAGGPLRSAHGTSNKVHPFDATWGQYLKPDLQQH
jgi:rhodanese-related sulfurtransferase